MFMHICLSCNKSKVTESMVIKFGTQGLWIKVTWLECLLLQHYCILSTFARRCNHNAADHVDIATDGHGDSDLFVSVSVN